MVSVEIRAATVAAQALAWLPPFDVHSLRLCLRAPASDVVLEHVKVDQLEDNLYVARSEWQGRALECQRCVTGSSTNRLWPLMKYIVPWHVDLASRYKAL